MFGSSFGDLAFRRVWNHSSFADEFNVHQEYSLLVFDVLYAELQSRSPFKFNVFRYL